MSSHHGANGTAALGGSAPPGAEITVLVAVRSPHVREGLVAMMGTLDGFRVVAEADSDEQAVVLARALRPVLAVVDQDLPNCGGDWTVRTLHGEGLVRTIVAIGLRADEGTRGRAISAGARAYVQTGASLQDLLHALSDAGGPRDEHPAAALPTPPPAEPATAAT